MKKFFFILTVAVVAVVSSLSVYAEKLTAGPVSFCSDLLLDKVSFTMESFEIISVQNIPDRNMSRINYVLKTDLDNICVDMVVHCYNQEGTVISTLEFLPQQGYIDVPELTAMLELSAKDALENSDSFLYSKYINVYAEDGRTTTIYDLLLPLYENVGWQSGVIMYSLDGRSLEVSPFLVQVYEKVGWYTKENIAYIYVQEQYEKNKLSEDYHSNIRLASEWIPFFEGTVHEASVNAIKSEAMDMWRIKVNTPIAYSGCSFEDRNGAMHIKVSLTNVSYKKVHSFKIKFEILDADGNVTGEAYDYYYSTKAELEVAETATYMWKNASVVSPAGVSNFKVVEIAFSDGTKWYCDRS
ncbi:MAG: FxLYD domain-containing protein [Clostridia bacterium]|nr:FxLYD domain-containing protein [Clostridia bacterium]